jgi:hypothetical protein
VTLASWLDARRPAPPAALRARIDATLGEALHDDGDVAALCLVAGERLVREIIRDNATSRESALDLLAADALVTYAFEAASEHPAELERRACDAMARISALAGEHGKDSNASAGRR